MKVPKYKPLLKTINEISLRNLRDPVAVTVKSKEAVEKFIEDHEVSKDELVDIWSNEAEASGDMDYLTAAETIKEYG